MMLKYWMCELIAFISTIMITILTYITLYISIILLYNQLSDWLNVIIAFMTGSIIGYTLYPTIRDYLWSKYGVD